MCSQEDYIFHLLSAQVTGGLLAEHPAHCIGNIAFAAAVWTDNSGHPSSKNKFCLVGEGLKSLNL